MKKYWKFTYRNVGLDESNAFSSLREQIHEGNVEHNSSAKAQQVAKLRGARVSVEQDEQATYRNRS